jgi:hypothetical protein
MTVEQLQSVHQARPFQPFTLHLADGSKVHVPHNEFLSRSPSGRTIVVQGAGDTLSIVDLLLVTRIEVHYPAPTVSTDGNGKAE